MTINEIMKIGVYELRKKNISEPILKMRILLASVLNKTKEFIIANGNYTLNEYLQQELLKKIEQLKEYIPIQYLIKKQEFMKLNFYVNENVLIPRSDTEILVEEIINKYNKDNLKILDICTGSGCIAISLKKYMPNTEIYATDISKEALKVANINAKNNNVKINFIYSDMFKNLKNKKFNIIVSNPPYIRTKIIPYLEKEVQKEPKLALDGGEDGLYFYREIIKEAYTYLKEKGIIFLEIGYDQKEEVINIIKKDNRYKFVECKKDLENNDRVIIIRKE